MTTGDLSRIDPVAAAVHPSFPEDAAVFAERLALYPRGCRVLESKSGAIQGYVVSHPWHDAAPPALNSLLHRLPSTPSTYYIHDLALLPAARGSGAAEAIVKALIKQARDSGAPHVSLVAVNGSEGFWRKRGFQRVDDEHIAAQTRSYGADACFMRLTLPPA